MADKFPGPKTRQALERGIPLFRNGLKFEAELEKAGRRGFRTANQVVIDRAEGDFIWDLDGNRYIDFLQAGGPTVLGSNYQPVQERVIALIRECGPVTGLFHEYELKLAELIHRHMPSIELFRMLGSGTEGVMAAIRAARCYTGKDKIIKVGGAYHGWSDSMVYALRIPGTAGFDAHENDLMSGTNLSTDGYDFVNDTIFDLVRASTGGRVVSVLEGGYDLQILPVLVANHIRKLMAI